MDRSIIYTDEGLRSFDHLSAWKDYSVGIARAVQAVLGTISTVGVGFGATPQSSPNMTINIGAGQVYSWASVDNQNFGSCPADTRMILQQGYADQQVLTFSSAGLGANQSQCFLVQVAYLQQDIIRVGDPTNGVPPYVNTANLLEPLQGPNGLGGTQPTMRNGLANVTIVPGAIVTSPAAPTAPAPTTGAIGLWVVTLTHNQAQITSGNIAPYPNSPIIAGLLNQHHTGVAGQAPQIDVTKEITGIVPFPNLPASNATPLTTGTSHVTASGVLSVSIQSNVNPNGVFAGNLQDTCFNTVTNTLYVCTTAGLTAGTTVWSPVGVTGGVQIITSFPFTPQAGAIYLCKTNSGAGSCTLLAASTYGGYPVEFKNVGSNTMSVYPATGTEQIGSMAAGNPAILNPGDGLRIAPEPSVGWHVLA